MPVAKAEAEIQKKKPGFQVKPGMTIWTTPCEWLPATIPIAMAT